MSIESRKPVDNNMQNKMQKFEEVMARLEMIVDELEQGDLNLEEALARFEEGIGLIRICTKHLDEAEQKIEILLEGEDGKVTFKQLTIEKE